MAIAMKTRKALATRGKVKVQHGKLTAAEQRNMILSMFFDGQDAEDFVALVTHCRIDLAACNGDAKQLTNVIAAHYRIARGHYDIDRAANDLVTFPPVAERIAKLKAGKLASTSGHAS